ncbi:hypothetical protein ACQKWADRAFT_140662 [Trichoderma austrokoningii]
MGESNTSDGLRSSSSTPSSPDASSLYGIIRRHCRETLLVKPLFWTNRHLELLRISFDEPCLAPKTDRLDHYAKRSPRYVGKRVMRSYLEQFHLLEYREKCIRAMFCGSDSPFLSNTKTLFIDLDEFRSYTVCEGIRLRKAGSEWIGLTDWPICAYIDAGRIEEWRIESLHLRQCSPQNAPVYAMLCQKLKQLRPANPLKEPYVAALLIAAAQYRRYIVEAYRPEDIPKLKIYPTQVLYSLKSQSSVYLYKTNIPSSLLDMFEHPTIAPPEPPRIPIQVFEIPREPVDTFCDRILALVFPTALDCPFEMIDSRRRKRA